jgi:AraC-like DNA-binding protein
VRLDDLAAASGMGRFQLLRAFRAAVGLPPHAYQLSLRVTRAMALIRSGLPLADVAAEAGFADQSHFTRRFAAVVGIPPARFRRAVC